MKLLQKIICHILGHRAGTKKVRPWGHRQYEWTLTCDRCGGELKYLSPGIRIVSIELASGWCG